MSSSKGSAAKVVTKKILVTGDQGPDFNIYLHSSEENPPLGSPPAVLHCSSGGSGLAHQILSAWEGGSPAEAIGFAPPLTPSPPTFAVWHPEAWGKATLNHGGSKNVWRVRRTLSPGEILTEISLPSAVTPIASDQGFQPGVILIIDNAATFRHPLGCALPHEAAWTDRDTWVVWKMVPPFCRGELWWRGVRAGVPERTAVIVSIEHLRMEPVRISGCISWERTAIDIARELDRNPSLVELRSVADVIVTIHGEGALWRRLAGGTPEFTLFFDPAHMECEWWKSTGASGGAYGYMTAFSATVAAEIARNGDPVAGIRCAIPRGLHAMRILHAWGHGPVAEGETPGFPAELTASVIREGINALDKGDRQPFGVFSETTIPAAEVAAVNSQWRIVLTGGNRPCGEPLYGLARRVAVYGEKELGGVPHARFGKMLTADRSEIEALRNLKTLIENYKKSKETKPLSLAVFGPPGAGKSFGVKEIAKEVLGNQCEILEFNLSQFEDSDLPGAFHQVRDRVLEGHLPVVFWDEFDSNKYKWLQFLLAPMQDGKFQEGQITHPIGRCIFVFAGGTSFDMEHFGPTNPDDVSNADTEKAWTEFKLLKGPDFKSRINGSLDVLGPNRRMVLRKIDDDRFMWIDDPEDVCFPLRRAILLRALLGLGKSVRLEMEHGLLSAMLETYKYTNGARSFEKICNSLGAKKDRYRPSDLPSDAVLDMNLDDLAEFKALLVRDDAFKDKAHLLARAFHDVWRTGKRKQQGKKPFNFDFEFETLPPNKQNDNLNAATRMPRNLLMGGLFLVSAKMAGTDLVSEIPENLVDVMAQEEHAQWVEDALADGYRQKRDGETRDDARLIHDCILPWEKLPDEQRDYDRWFIRMYPAFAKKAGFGIVARKP